MLQDMKSFNLAVERVSKIDPWNTQYDTWNPRVQVRALASSFSSNVTDTFAWPFISNTSVGTPPQVLKESMWIDTGTPYTAIASIYCWYCDNNHDGLNQTSSTTFVNSTNTAYNNSIFIENRTIQPHGIWALDGWFAEDTFCLNSTDNSTCVENFTFFLYLNSVNDMRAGFIGLAPDSDNTPPSYVSAL